MTTKQETKADPTWKVALVCYFAGIPALQSPSPGLYYAGVFFTVLGILLGIASVYAWIKKRSVKRQNPAGVAGR